MKKIKTINVLGTDYTMEFLMVRQDKKLEKLDGYCDNTTKRIVVGIVDDDEMSVGNLTVHYSHVIRHELVHAFLYESGLANSSEWANDETIVDWIALQFPKMLDVYEKLGVQHEKF